MVSAVIGGRLVLSVSPPLARPSGVRREAGPAFRSGAWQIS